MADATLLFDQQIERLSVLLLMIVVGSLLDPAAVPAAAWWFVPLVLFVVRPFAVWCGLLGANVTALQRGLIAWFGIRGLGCVFYLTYAISHDLPEPLAETLSGLVLATVTASVILHGVSVTPLMDRYRRPPESAA